MFEPHARILRGKDKGLREMKSASNADEMVSALVGMMVATIV